LGGSLGCEGPFGFERRGMLLSQRPYMLRPKRFTDTCGNAHGGVIALSGWVQRLGCYSPRVRHIFRSGRSTMSIPKQLGAAAVLTALSFTPAPAQQVMSSPLIARSFIQMPIARTRVQATPIPTRITGATEARVRARGRAVRPSASRPSGRGPPQQRTCADWRRTSTIRIRERVRDAKRQAIATGCRHQSTAPIQPANRPPH
jgi:hypothetical protein